MDKNKKVIVVFFLLMAIVGTSLFISYSKFNVLNPLSTANGLFQVIFIEKQYIEIQKYPKVIVAKPSASLRDYMKSKGFQEDKENQMGAVHRFQNGDSVQYVMYSTNKYFSKWGWQE